jgi:hypothetical protein
MNKTKTLDLFVTDIDYSADEEQVGRCWTQTPGKRVETDGAFASKLKVGLMVRFLSATTATDYMTIRSVRLPGVVYIGNSWFTVDTAVELPNADTFYIQLVRQWIPKTLPLQTRFQHVTAVEILAYTLVGLSSATAWETHAEDETPPNLEFVGLEIKELPGRMLSTNRYMQNALAVLPTHMDSYHPNSWLEARDAMIFVPSCMARTDYETPLLAVNSITPQFIDRRGGLVRAVRFHLWLRLTVIEK